MVVSILITTTVTHMVVMDMITQHHINMVMVSIMVTVRVETNLLY